MTSLARAKEFLARKAAKLALTIVPLAALTAITPPAAHAGVIFSVDNCVATTLTHSGGCTAAIQGLPGADSEFPWVSVFGSIVDNVGTSSMLDATGSASGSTVGGDIPVSWLFSLLSTKSGTADWNVSATLWDTDNDVLGFFFASGSTGFNSTVSGSGTMTVSPGDVGSWEFSVSANENSGNFTYTLKVPGNASIDFNPQETPEPSSLLLGLTGGGALLLLLRRKKAE